MSLYASIDYDILADYSNSSLSQLLYYALKESAKSEENSRMTAMDSVSKNTGEMIDKLIMSFNRTRQRCFACFNFLKTKSSVTMKSISEIHRNDGREKVITFGDQ